MKTRLKQLAFLLIVGLFGLAAPAWAAVEDASGSAVATFKAGEIRQLIAQLGDEQYLQRQLAETQLLQLGAEAFAELQTAANHSDLEIVARAKYILSQIRIEWVRPTDSAVVRSIMTGYGELSHALRLTKVAQLSRLENEQGFGALCRIARFDTSVKVVRHAALSILENGFLPVERTAAAVAMLTGELGLLGELGLPGELGESNQVSLPWISVYVDQLQASESIDPRWLPLIDAEIERLAEETFETEKPLVVNLLRCHLELCDQLSDAKAIYANWRRRIDLSASSDQEIILGLVEALTWIIKHEQWGALEPLEDHFAETLNKERLLLYLVALSRDKQGRSQDAEQLADRALLLEIDDAVSRNYIAELIGELGRHDWAEKEWRHVVETLPTTDVRSLSARNRLAELRLHDRRDDKAAADLLSESIEAINKDPVIRQQYQRSENLRSLRRAIANREFFLACHYETLADYEKQRRHLDQAIRLAPGNADVLIAMYRLQDASDAYRKSTAERIAKVQLAMEHEIKQAPNDAQSYNQWAWLISNTEGDFDKAVERSQRSLELTPESPSYMDTLGRCYYAAGDLENAAKIQRAAVAKHPHMRVMQRQLKFFESALRKRQPVE